MREAAKRITRTLRLRDAVRAIEALGIGALREVASRRVSSLAPGGVTVVVVNWNSLEFLRVLHRAVRRFSPDDVRILVVDNGSRDGSRPYIRRETDLREVLWPYNMGHERALDVGFLLSRTEFAVALDVDAFPIRSDWIERLIEPLENGYTISGAHLNRNYVHPCCLAMRVARFAERGYSFRSNYIDGAGDVGELMATRDEGPLYFFEPTERRGPGDVGTVFGDVVYHNFYGTRFAGTTSDRLDRVVSRDDPALAWAEAVAKYLPSSM